MDCRHYIVPSTEYGALLFTPPPGRGIIIIHIYSGVITEDYYLSHRQVTRENLALRLIVGKWKKFSLCPIFSLTYPTVISLTIMMIDVRFAEYGACMPAFWGFIFKKFFWPAHDRDRVPVRIILRNYFSRLYLFYFYYYGTSPTSQVATLCVISPVSLGIFILCMGGH